MTNKELVLDTMKKYGKLTAETLQSQSETLTATKIVAQEDYIPTFENAVINENMINRPAGFLCKDGDYTVKLLTPYDSSIYTQSPLNYPSMWAFQWSNDLDKAKDFVSISTSPYMADNVCLYENRVYKSLIDNNTWSPIDYPVGWKVQE